MRNMTFYSLLLLIVVVSSTGCNKNEEDIVAYQYEESLMDIALSYRNVHFKQGIAIKNDDNFGQMLHFKNRKVFLGTVEYLESLSASEISQRAHINDDFESLYDTEQSLPEDEQHPFTVFSNLLSSKGYVSIGDTIYQELDHDKQYEIIDGKKQLIDNLSIRSNCGSSSVGYKYSNWANDGTCGDFRIKAKFYTWDLWGWTKRSKVKVKFQRSICTGGYTSTPSGEIKIEGLYHSNSRYYPPGSVHYHETGVSQANPTIEYNEDLCMEEINLNISGKWQGETVFLWLQEQW